MNFVSVMEEDAIEAGVWQEWGHGLRFLLPGDALTLDNLKRAETEMLKLGTSPQAQVKLINEAWSAAVDESIRRSKG